MLTAATETDWAAMWAPYDEPTYAAALAHIAPGSTVLDIGAGDLRFTRRVAERARLVYAVERRPELVAAATALPPNLRLICGDARAMPFPAEIDTAVLLMRHCRDFGLYARKLAAAGCRTLITNARWGMAVECIALDRPALPYAMLVAGWYACRCGATGFRDGPPDRLVYRHIDTVSDVATCPACATG